MFGFVEVFMFVAVSERNKRVTLAKIPCDYHEADDRFLEFRKANERIHSADIHARFQFSEYIG